MAGARNFHDCASYDIEQEILPVVVGNQCVQLVSIPRKIYDQLQDDTAPIRDIVHDIQMATGAVIKAVDRETSRLSSPGQVFGQQKARKEYFFQVTGSMSQVERTRDEINRVLKKIDPRERVSLKMDVSFSDHSFVIGRFGRGIQLVSHETNCLIHFPDSNKNSQYEKSNQVSISGPPEGVMEARRRIRKLLPISFAFVIADIHHNKAMVQLGPQVFETPPKVQQMINILQNEHRITITMLPMHSLQSSAALVTVRGRHANIDRIKEGILKLMAFLVPDDPHLSVYVGIEVSPHHLDFVTGPGGVKLVELMRETRTTIEIPEVLDRRQSIPTVRIVGQVLNVYEAWVKFMDLLPLALLVEIPGNVDQGQEMPTMSPESAWSVGEDHLSSLGEDCAFSAPSFGASKIDDVAHALNEHLEPYDITLISRQKSREIRQWWLVIKGPEKYVDIMFEIHKSLNQDDPVAHVLSYLQKIPEPPSYCFRPNNAMNTLQNSSNVDLRFRPMAANLANRWGQSGLSVPPTALCNRPPPLALAWPQDDSPSSMTSTPIKVNRPSSSNLAETASCAPNFFWQNPSDGLPTSFINNLEDSMDSLTLSKHPSINVRSMDRDSFVTTKNTKSFCVPLLQTGSTLGSVPGMTLDDKACCSTMSNHSLLDEEIFRDVTCDLPASPCTDEVDSGSCANHCSFPPSSFGCGPYAATESYFASSRNSLYKNQPRDSILSSFNLDHDSPFQTSKSLTMELEPTSSFNPDLGLIADSGFSVSKDNGGDLEHDLMFFKTSGERRVNDDRYNLWGRDDSGRGKKFDAAPGSGRESHT